ncbi:PRC-barrel domain containing protein [Salinigranum salinum]|uniref:PRC-barrel domain containing protein n=1 Tax=Salinigranum salinum TaxID=1364937 RepID=UPI001260ED28|nr:PRC-barrel domain containing protein [Salinigranum salinum]
MRRPRPSLTDVGKHVVDERGTVLGTVSAVNEGVPYVDLDSDVVREVTSALSWQRVGDEEGLPLDVGAIERITTDQVRLRTEPQL